jgi:succinoglycan biosynthesis protein ExoM
MANIDIGIATFRRPALLVKLLDSISLLDVPDKFQVRVIVADNDHNFSSKPIVTGLKNKYRFEIIYLEVPERGISFARNAILDLVDADYLAFLDDDETVEPGWLKSMFQAVFLYKADVVFGPVRANLPAEVPRWAIEHPSFVRPVIRASGATVRTGATNNVLMKSEILRKTGIKFDPTFALTGGSDSLFFRLIWKAGYRMVWCADAVVYEDVPPERLRLAWILKRSYRSGQVQARILQKEKSFAEIAARVSSKFLLALVGLPGLPLVAVVSFPFAVRLGCRFAGWTGGFFAVFLASRLYREYSDTSYRPD